MSTSRSFAQLGQKMDAYSKRIEAVPRIATREACLEAKRVMRASLAAAGAPSERLGGVGKRGARLGVRFDVNGAGARAEGVIAATGPWQFIEENTRAHAIPKRKGRKRVKLPDGSIRRSVQHPGTKGKHPWAKGAAIVRQTSEENYEKAANTAMRQVF